MTRNPVVLVTGAASGIGRAIALRYASDGFRVVVSDVDEAGGQETVRQIEEGGHETLFVLADESDPAACEALVAETVRAFGRLDVACNNAGVRSEHALAASGPIEAWQRLVAVNLSGVFYGMGAQIPAILASGGGLIVNVGSILNGVRSNEASAYIAAMQVMAGLSKDAALEYGPMGIRVNAVRPAFIETPVISALEEDPETLPMRDGLHLAGRLDTPDEVAALVSWLSSDDASLVTGAYYYPVDGGYLAR